LIPTANLTWRTARRIGWPSLRYVTKDTGRKIALLFSRPSFIRWIRIMLTCKFFLKAHNERNLAEYEGRMEIDEGLLADRIRCTKKLETARPPAKKIRDSPPTGE
jgi:hypothetical protein